MDRNVTEHNIKQKYIYNVNALTKTRTTFYILGGIKKSVIQSTTTLEEATLIHAAY